MYTYYKHCDYQLLLITITSGYTDDCVGLSSLLFPTKINSDTMQAVAFHNNIVPLVVLINGISCSTATSYMVLQSRTPSLPLFLSQDFYGAMVILYRSTWLSQGVTCKKNCFVSLQTIFSHPFSQLFTTTHFTLNFAWLHITN